MNRLDSICSEKKITLTINSLSFYLFFLFGMEKKFPKEKPLRESQILEFCISGEKILKKIIFVTSSMNSCGHFFVDAHQTL